MRHTCKHPQTKKLTKRLKKLLRVAPLSGNWRSSVKSEITHFVHTGSQIDPNDLIIKALFQVYRISFYPRNVTATSQILGAKS